MAFVSALNRPDSDCLVCMGEPDNGPIVVHDDQHPIHKVCLERLAAQQIAERKPTECPSCRIKVTHINGEPVAQPEEGVAPVPGANEVALNDDEVFRVVAEGIDEEEAEEIDMEPFDRAFYEAKEAPNEANLQTLKALVSQYPEDKFSDYLEEAVTEDDFAVLAVVLSAKKISEVLRSKLVLKAIEEKKYPILLYLLKDGPIYNVSQLESLEEAAKIEDDKFLKALLAVRPINKTELLHLVTEAIGNDSPIKNIRFLINYHELSPQAKGLILIAASGKGLKPLVRHLLLFPIGERDLGLAICEAIDNDHFNLVPLLFNENFADRNRYLAITKAINKEHLPTLRHLFKNYEPTPEKLAEYVQNINFTNLPLLKFLLGKGVILEKERGHAVIKAVNARANKSVEVLLMYAISIEDRGEAVIKASQLGDIDCLDLLLTNDISERYRGMAVKTGLKHEQIVGNLLRSGPIPQQDREDSLYDAAYVGHIGSVKHLLKEKMSEKALKAAKSAASSEEVRNAIRSYLPPQNSFFPREFLSKFSKFLEEKEKK